MCSSQPQLKQQSLLSRPRPWTGHIAPPSGLFSSASEAWRPGSTSWGLPRQLLVSLLPFLLSTTSEDPCIDASPMSMSGGGRPTAYLPVWTQARQIPRLRQAGIQQIHTLLNMKDDMVERYGFPEDLSLRWHSEQRQVQSTPDWVSNITHSLKQHRCRHCEDLLQSIQPPSSNAILSFIKTLGWRVRNDRQLEALNARRDAVKVLIDEWSAVSNSLIINHTSSITSLRTES